MIELCSKNECTSCLACYNACDYQAIVLEENEYGEIQPHIDRDKCRECGKCRKVCPQLNENNYQRADCAFALVTKNKYDRETCSSGGVATTLAKYIIENEGIVFGATIIGGEGKYIAVSHMDDLEILKGSKYVHCSTGHVYQQVKQALKSGRLCIFFGIPCQVAGLKAFLGKTWNNLILIDLVCHGTSPYTYLLQHVRNVAGNVDNVDKITFRGAKDFFLSLYDYHGNCLYQRRQDEDKYFKAFMNQVIFRDVCYQCKYARSERISDITIGDFWGLSSDALNGYTGKISLALPNTTKGKTLLEDTSDIFEWEIRSIDEAINGNEQLRVPSNKPDMHIKFRKSYEHDSDFEKALGECGIIRQVRLNILKNSMLLIPRQIKREITKIWKR